MILCVASPHFDLTRLERITKIEVLLEELVDCISDCNNRLMELETLMGTRGDSEQLVCTHWIQIKDCLYVCIVHASQYCQNGLELLKPSFGLKTKYLLL